MKYLIYLIFFNFGLYASSQSQKVTKEANALAKKYHLANLGVGFYGPNKGFDFSYIIYRGMTIEDSRKLVVWFSQDLQRNTNLFELSSEFEGEEDGKKVLMLSFTSLDTKGNYIFGNGYITKVSLFFGVLNYYTYDGSRFDCIYEEKFEDAIQKVLNNCL